MSSSNFSFNLQEQANKPLASLFCQDLVLPAQVELTNSSLDLNNGNENVSETDGCELIVFSTLTLGQLHRLIQKCKIKLIQLTTSNTRLERTSYRFSVHVEDIKAARSTLTEYCLAEQIEAALVQNAPKLAEPGLLVMDMDSTTITIECIDEIAVLAGVGPQVAEVTERAMQGELDFAQSLHQRVATLADAPESILAEVAKDIPLMDGLEVLIQALKAHQWKIAIASGGFTYFADHLKHGLQLDAAYANTLEIVDGKLTGKVLGDVVDALVKAQVLTKLQQENSIAPTQTVAMGDGANDLIMMQAAQLGVAFRAKPIVQAQAATCLNQSGLDGMVHWLA